MKRVWTTAAFRPPADSLWSPPWTCQLMRAESVSEGLILDLVAMEPCPAPQITCDAYEPVTLHIDRDHVPDRTWDEAFARWTARGDVVTILCGAVESTAWLVLMNDGCCLVVELTTGT